MDEAVRRILANISALPARRVPLREARGLVLAERIVAGSDSPRFDTAAMDGYAVRASDMRGAVDGHPLRLAITGAITAGAHGDVRIAPGTAIRIMTGAQCPAGANVVLPFELAQEHGNWIEAQANLAAGANIRRAGEDYRAGEALLESGARLSPAHLAIIAAEGYASLGVVPRPRVALIATGDELVPPGQTLASGQIRDSNSCMVTGLIEQFGGEIACPEIVTDDSGALLASLRRHAADDVDLIVTIGGASRGDRDVLTEIGSDDAQLAFWDVRMKPGRPLVCGRIDGVPVIGLPGNPAAAFVSAVQFVRPAVLALLGQTNILPPVISAAVAEPVFNAGGRRNFVRVTLEQDTTGLRARLAGPQNAANLLTLSRADGLLVIPETMDHVEPGMRLDVQLIRDL